MNIVVFSYMTYTAAVVGAVIWFNGPSTHFRFYRAQSSIQTTLFPGKPLGDSSPTLCSQGERGGLVLESLTRTERSGFDTYLRRVRSLSKDTFPPRKVLVIPRKWWLRPDMTEKLLTGTLSINTNKQTKLCSLISSPEPKAHR